MRMATVTRTFELSVEAAAGLDRRAQAAHCAPSEFLDLMFLDIDPRELNFTPEQWEMIRQGEAEADAGVFASAEEVEEIFSKYRGAV